MSFNTNDNSSIISRTNYEEYFLLYVDNELSPEEKLAVDNFLLANPDLQAEMDILLSTKLPAETINLMDKESLMAESMCINTIDESLLLYIDEELGKVEKEKVEGRLKADKEFQLQHQALLQTKLDPSEIMAYPNKEELYRRTERRIVPYWLRIAAAAILVSGIGTLAIINQKSDDQSAVAINPDNTNKPENSVKNQPAIQAPASTPVVAERQETSVEKQEKEITPSRDLVEKTNTQVLAKRETSKHKNEPTAPVAEPKDNNLPQPKLEVPANVVAATEPIPVPKQSINNQPVTSPAVVAYHKQEIAPETAEQRDDFIAEVDNEKKASLKGFLRKATRFIERRTNIKATNENDELLIGAVALKL